MTLLTAERLTQLDMPSYVGQRSATFRFGLINVITGRVEADLTPLRSTVPTLTHDTTRTIKRQLQGLTLDVADTARVNVIQSRVLLYMIIGGREFPLGRYMFADDVKFVYTNGRITNATLFDEMFMVDQQIETTYTPPITALTQGGIPNVPMNCAKAITDLLIGFDVTTEIEPTPYGTIGSWPAGTTRGQIIEQIALDGDWFPPWFGNDTKMHFVRAFDPATAVVTFDLDTGFRVVTNSIIESSDLIVAPNRFVVISNGAISEEDTASPLVGTADVPNTAPHSIENRGFVVPSVTERQVNSQLQVTAIAQNLALRQNVFERTELATVPDPRHDSYDVIRWQGENWLELTWTLPLIEGAAMGHVMRKAYS